MKNIRQRLVAFIAGILLGPAIVYGGLETGTYISDLVATNPLSSDLASTSDDHIRLLKSTIKATFPNINNAVTVTDEQLNAVATNVAANPTGTIGLSAVNGSATTYLRSDGAPVLSQAIAPTWSAAHAFSLPYTAVGSGTAVTLSSALPMLAFNDSDSSANNRLWQLFANSELLQLRTVTDDGTTASGAIFIVDRTGATVDSVAFPTESSNAFQVGTNGGNTIAIAKFRTTNATRAALSVNTTSTTASQSPLIVQHEATSNNNIFVEFRTEANAGTVRGQIDFDRAGVLTRYVTTSDQRLKKNFKPAPSARGVIDCIKIESFDWRENGNHVDHGVVAQRLNKCAPYAVSKGDVWQVDKSTLIPALIKYVQEQEARIADLERRLH